MYFRNKNYRADVNGMLYKVSEERYYDDYVYNGGEEEVSWQDIIYFRYVNSLFRGTRVIINNKTDFPMNCVRFERCWFSCKTEILILGRTVSELIFTDCVFDSEIQSEYMVETLNIQIKDVEESDKVSKGKCVKMTFINCRTFNKGYVEITGDGVIENLNLKRCGEMYLFLNGDKKEDTSGLRVKNMNVEYGENMHVCFKQNMLYDGCKFNFRFSKMNLLSFGKEQEKSSGTKLFVRMEYCVVQKLCPIDNVELTNECSIVEEDHGGLSNESRIE